MPPPLWSSHGLHSGALSPMQSRKQGKGMEKIPKADNHGLFLIKTKESIFLHVLYQFILGAVIPISGSQDLSIYTIS